MIQAYPVTLTKDDDGSVIASFPDIPEANTVGADKNNALEWAQDGLVVALSGYLDERKDIPYPSTIQEKQESIALPPQVAMKLAIYQGMREQHVTQASLAENMGIDGRQVRRILDLDHNSSLSHLISALNYLGKTVKIDITDAP